MPPGAVAENSWNELVRSGNQGNHCCIALGMLAIAASCFMFCINEGDRIHNLRAANNAMESTRTESCHLSNTFAGSPTGMIHIQGCPVSLPNNFTSFDMGLLAPVYANGTGLVRSPWVRLRLQYNDRRRSGGWKDVDSVGTMPTLRSGLQLAYGTKAGDFTLAPSLVTQIPGRTLEVNPLPQNFTGHWPWSINLKTNEIWNGDDRAIVTIGEMVDISVLAGAQPVPSPSTSREILLKPWLADASWGKRVARLEIGRISSTIMFEHQRSEAEIAAGGSRILLFFVSIFGVWFSLWPVEPQMCILITTGRAPQATVGDCFRICSSLFRAILIAAIIALVSIGTGWMWFEHGFLMGILAMSFLLLLFAVIECGQKLNLPNMLGRLPMMSTSHANPTEESELAALTSSEPAEQGMAGLGHSSLKGCGTLLLFCGLVIGAIVAANIVLSFAFGGTRV